MKRSIVIHGAKHSTRADVDVLNLTDIPKAIASCCDGISNFRAMELCRRLVDGRTKFPPVAVYVICPTGLEVAKIGIASNPKKRMEELQVGNWNKLSVAALIWTDSGAGEIERLAHIAAKEMGQHLRGEWISANLADACELVLKAARYTSRPVYDSATWIGNWGTRLEALADAKQVTSRINRALDRANREI